MKSKLGNIILLICLAAALCQVADGKNIVFFFGVGSYSHRVPAWPLAEALADKGHNITFVSPYVAKNPNPKIFDYVPNTVKKFLESMEDTINVFEDRKNEKWTTGWLMLPFFGIMICQELYNDEEYVEWIKSTKVDLVFVDALVNDCAYGMAHYWGAKVILYDTSAPFAHFPEAHGLPDETSWISNFELSYPINMSFLQRLTNALFPIAMLYYRKWYFFPQLEELTREKLGITDLPKFEELERKTCLVFLNIHHAEEFARSLPPNVIPIGGIAFNEQRKELPKEIEAFLEKGDGFIYISFGTFADFRKFDAPIQQAFIKTVQRLPHVQFIWKVDNDTLIKEFPEKNVYTSSWMPQQDILAHPKIRAFITHSGLISIQESIYNSVPLISFPIFAEQDYNAERIHHRECGIRLEITTVTQAQLEEAIQKVLTDRKYQDNMKKISKIFTDRPQKPLETALWWTEFVIRHSQEDLLALRPSSVGQSWWKRRQLDVWTTIIGSITALLSLCTYLMYKLLKCAFRVNVSSAKPSKKSTQKKKVQ